MNYFPSRYDPARHSDRYPITRQVYTAARERAVIGKENNFKQASLFSLLLSVIALYVSQAGERTVASKRRAVQAGRVQVFYTLAGLLQAGERPVIGKGNNVKQARSPVFIQLEAG